MTQLKFIILGALLLTACAHVPGKTSPNAPGQAEAAKSPAQPKQPVAAPVVLPDVELNSDLLYEILMTDIASQRGQPGLAADDALDLARKTRDPRLAMRAAHLAIESGQMDKAIEALRIWQQIDPNSQTVSRLLSSVLLRNGMIEEARQEFVKVLKAEGDHTGQTFLQLYQMLAVYPDRAAALKLLRELAAPYPGVAEAHWAEAQLAQAAGDQALALREARRARDLRPEWDMAVSLEASLLQKSSPQQGLDVLKHYLSDYPDAHEIRLQYARALLEQKQYIQSRAEFQRLSNENPDNPELAYATALISLQLNDLQSAEKELKQALEKGKKDRNTVQYYLGQLSEAKNSNDEAIAYYREVRGGEFLAAAQIRLAYLLSKGGQIAEARRILDQVVVSNDQQRAQIALIEAQLLRDAGQYAESFQVLQSASEKMPNDPDLLYGAAMMADKIGKQDVFEKMMRQVIKIRPDYAQAYNALGYSLLDRNERIPEALALVEKALQLAPDDASIMDSVGWGYFRSGRLDDSVKMLRRAYASDPDPEIAAHLGEALWVSGDKDGARKVWQESLKANPGSAPLQAVIKKFEP